MLTWCELNELSIIYVKTKFMIVKNIKVFKEPSLIMGDQNNCLVHRYEHLGVLLDDTLYMNEYLDTTWKKANSNIGILSKIGRFMSEKNCLENT